MRAGKDSERGVEGGGGVRGVSGHEGGFEDYQWLSCLKKRYF